MVQICYMYMYMYNINPSLSFTFCIIITTVIFVNAQPQIVGRVLKVNSGGGGGGGWIKGVH